MAVVEQTAEQLYAVSRHASCFKCGKYAGDTKPKERWFITGDTVYCSKCAEQHVVKP
jgi:hypothetical protein